MNPASPFEHFPRIRLWTLATLLVACGGPTEDATAPEPAADPKVAAAPAAAEPATPDDPGLSAADLSKGAENVALVPSPIETQRALERAGIDAELATMVPRHEFDMKTNDIDHAAVRTGVVLADALLTVKTAEKKALLGRLSQLQKGMSQLDGGTDIDGMLIDMKDRIKADAVTRDELLKEFDELSGAVIPELEFAGKERVLPLIEAGSWLEGANLVARAVKKAGKTDAADTLLKQPAVVDYFIDYVHDEGADKAPAAVTTKLEESLAILKELRPRRNP
jgi:hypothetical protein